MQEIDLEMMRCIEPYQRISVRISVKYHDVSPVCSHLGLILVLGEHPTYEGSVQRLLVGIRGGGRIGGTSESTGRRQHISTEQALLV